MGWKDNGDNFSFHRVRFMYTTNRTWRRIALVALIVLFLLVVLLISLLLWYFLFRSSNEGNGPAQSGGGGGWPRYGGCFPSAATVVTPLGVKRMDELHLGDLVLDLDSGGRCCAWTGVYAFAFVDDHQRVLTRLALDDGRVIVLTADHLVFRDGLDEARAAVVRVGDSLYTANGTGRVSSVQSVLGAGAHNPLTHSGTLLVDGVWVSCFAGAWLRGLIGHRFINQYATAPLRALAALLELTSTEELRESLFVPQQYHLWYVRLLKSLHSLF